MLLNGNRVLAYKQVSRVSSLVIYGMFDGEIPSVLAGYASSNKRPKHYRLYNSSNGMYFNFKRRRHYINQFIWM